MLGLLWLEDLFVHQLKSTGRVIHVRVNLMVNICHVNDSTNFESVLSNTMLYS